MQKLEKKGFNVDELITESLIELGLTRDEANIEILKEPKKGFLGIGSKKGLVKVSKKRDILNDVKKIAEELFYRMNAKVDIKVEKKEKNNLLVNVDGEDVGYLIGKQGTYLDSLQYFLNLAVNKGNGKYFRVKLDIGNFRKKRKEKIIDMAKNMAEKAKNINRKVVLNPMNSYERRIVHTALQEENNITTFSKGKEPYRKVVITVEK